MSGLPPDTDGPDFVRVSYELTFADLWAMARAKWPGIRMSEITIKAENLQTNSFGFDQHDPSDYTDFTLMTAAPEYFARMTSVSPAAAPAPSAAG